MESAEQLLPALRVLLAQELISRHGYRKKRLAQLMGITPSAITQYLRGRRGRRGSEMLASYEEIRLIVSDLAKAVVEREKRGVGGLEPMELIDAAYRALSVIRGLRTLEEKRESGGASLKTQHWLEVLRGRLRDEISLAQRNLKVAATLRDEFTRFLFREIATNSLRHADIISLLIAKLESEGGFEFDAPAVEVLQEMILEEDRIAEQPLARLVKADHPIVEILLRSIDADEAKHIEMLKSLLKASA